MNTVLKRSMLLIIAVISFIGIFIYVNNNLYRFFATTPTIKTNLSPVTQSKNVGEEFVVNVLISGQDIYATDLNIVFDSDYLQFYKEYTPTKTGVILTDTLFEPIPAIETVTTVDSTRKRLRVVLISQSKAVGSATSIGLKFKTLKAGTGTVTIEGTSLITGKDVTSGTAVNYTLGITDPKSTVTIGSTTAITPTPIGTVCTANPLPTTTFTKTGILSQSLSKTTLLTQRVTVEKNRTYTFKLNAANTVALVQTLSGISLQATMAGDAGTSTLTFGTLPKTVSNPTTLQTTWNSGNNTYVDITLFANLPPYIVGPTPTGSQIMFFRLVPEVYAVTAPDPSYGFTASGLSFISCAAPTAVPPTNTPVPPTATPTKAPTATPKPQLPAPLTLTMTCNSAASQATFTWSAVTGAVGGYYLTADNTNNAFPGGAGDIAEWGLTVTTITKPILLNTPYTYSVQALDGGDSLGVAKTGRFQCNSPTATPVPPTNTPVPPTATPTKAPTATPIPKLPAPTTISAICNAAGTQVTFAWKAVTGAVGGYFLSADNTTNAYPGGAGDIYDWGLTVTTITKTITSNAPYKYSVQALDGGDNLGLANSGTFQCNTPTSTPVPPPATPTKIPPTSTPVPVTPTKIVATNTPAPNCSLRAKGDANCDGIVDLLDYSCWRGEFLGSKPSNCVSADFDSLNGAALLDFSIWKITFLSNNQ